MFLRFFVIVFVLLVSVSIATAGLDNAGRFDNVVAVYYFEDETDSGPREFDGLLLENASITNNGKVDKCLKLTGEDSFGTLDTLGFGIVNREFAIVAWVKLPTQTDALAFLVGGYDDDDTNIGAILLRVEASGNISGGQFDFEDSKSHSIETSDQNVTDNKWHHIAYTKYANTYALYIDGKQVKEEHYTNYVGFFGENTLLSVDAYGDGENPSLTGNVFIDELGIFETGFSIYEISGLYDDGLSGFLEAMPVDPQEKTATTWGELKRRRF